MRRENGRIAVRPFRDLRKPAAEIPTPGPLTSEEVDGRCASGEAPSRFELLYEALQASA